MLRSRTAATAAVVALMAAAFLLRCRGLDFGLPHITYRDGFNYFSHVDYVRRGLPPESNLLWGWYPHLVPRLALLFSDPAYEALERPLDLAGHLARASSPWMLLRWIAMSLSILAIPGTYLLGRRFLSRIPALFASALTAFSLLHVAFGQQEKPHGPVSAFVVLAVVAALHFRTRPGWGSALLAATAAGLAIGSLQSGAAVLLALAAAWWLREPRAWRPMLLPLAASALVIAGLFRFFYPFYFSEGVSFFQSDAEGEGEESSVLNLSGHPVFLDRFRFKGAAVVLDTLLSYDPAILLGSVAALATLAVLAWRGRRMERGARADLWVVLAYAVPYLLAVSAYNLAYERFMMPALPFFAVLAGAGLHHLLAATARRPALRATVSVVALAVLAFHAAAAWNLARVRAAPDTQAQVADWLAANTREGERIYVMPYFDLPLLYDDESLAAVGYAGPVMYWMTYQSGVAGELKLGRRFALFQPKTWDETHAELGGDPLGALRALGTDYVVIQAVGDDFRYELVKKLRAQLRREAELAFRCSPVGDPTTGSGQVGIRYSQKLGKEPLALRIFRCNSVGNTLEVYRLRAPDEAR
jgi:hypothetical protein